MRTYIVFINSEGRYLVNILRNGDVETTKMPEDARSWPVDSKVRLSKLDVFLETNKEILNSKGFILKEIKKEV